MSTCPGAELSESHCILTVFMLVLGNWHSVPHLISRFENVAKYIQICSRAAEPNFGFDRNRHEMLDFR